MNDKELIEALKAEGKKSGVNTPTNRAWRRLAELTQPQPIETAPRDGTDVIVLGGKVSFPNSCTLTGVYSMPKRGVLAWYSEQIGLWLAHEDCLIETPPTHWLPCVEVDLSALEGKGDGA